jgi:PAS domain S-box-containing protein
MTGGDRAVGLERQRNDALLAENQRLRHFFRLYATSSALTAQVDLSGRFVEFSDAWCTTLGFPREDFKGRRVFDLVHPDDIERTIVEARRLTEEGYFRNVRNRCVCADGSYVWLSWHGLMWQGCPQGTSGDECGAGIITWSTWEAALAYCEELSLGGLSDWRLPDINELQSIVDYRYESLSIDPDVFPGPSNSGWTSTTRTSYTGHALIVNFEVGNTSSIAKADLAGSVRCVHDP